MLLACELAKEEVATEVGSLLRHRACWFLRATCSSQAIACRRSADTHYVSAQSTRCMMLHALKQECSAQHLRAVRHISAAVCDSSVVYVRIETPRNHIRPCAASRGGAAYIRGRMRFLGISVPHRVDKSYQSTIRHEGGAVAGLDDAVDQAAERIA
eukprot:SAG11_NODE_114_length_16040_cov_10.050875_8_plen_156_part_00